MIVLSICDGKATGLAALKQLGIHPTLYFGVEINPIKRKIADANWSNQIDRSCDDVYKLLEHIKLYGIGKIDLILAGPTCTSLSSQGKREEWDGESKIFFACAEIVKLVKKENPNVKILFENVASMRNKCRDDISKVLGLPYWRGLSRLVSAQDRVRYYWFNWEPPTLEDRGITFNSILDSDGLVGIAFSKSNRNEKGKPAIVEGRVKSIPKANTVTTGIGGAGQSTKNYVITKKMAIRNLTVSEGAKLQGVQDYDFSMCSEKEAWEALGDGWQLDTVVEILRKGLL